MGDLPHPPKLKLTPHLRAFLAGELYPPEEPYEQPPRIDEETRQRNLQGIEDARAALHSKKPYKEGTEGMWALAAGRLAGGAVARSVGTKTGSPMIGRMAGSAAASGVNDMLSGDHRAYEAGTEGQDYFGPRKRYDPDKKRAERNRSRQGGDAARKALIEQREADEEAALAEEEMRLGKAAIDDLPSNPTFDEVEQKLLAESQEEDSVVWRSGNANPDLLPIEGLEEFYDEGVAGQWFYDVKPSPVDYFRAGTHGQEMGPIYNNYGSTGFAQPAVTTPKKAGPPPPGATSSRPVEDKPPTLSSRSYFSSGTQGQKYGMPPEARGKKKKRPNRTGEPKPPLPRTDKTTPHDTLTREELLRLREEEAEKERNKPPPGTYKPKT